MILLQDLIATKTNRKLQWMSLILQTPAIHKIKDKNILLIQIRLMNSSHLTINQTLTICLISLLMITMKISIYSISNSKIFYKGKSKYKGHRISKVGCGWIEIVLQTMLSKQWRREVMITLWYQIWILMRIKKGKLEVI